MLATKAYLEAKQADDVRRDLGAKLNMSSGPFLPSDKIHYRAEDKSKIMSDGSRGGKWINGKLLTIEAV